MHSFELIHVVWRKYVAKMKIISDIYFSVVEILINMDMFLTQERDFFFSRKALIYMFHVHVLEFVIFFISRKVLI